MFAHVTLQSELKFKCESDSTCKKLMSKPSSNGKIFLLSSLSLLKDQIIRNHCVFTIKNTLVNYFEFNLSVSLSCDPEIVKEIRLNLITS